MGWLIPESRLDEQQRSVVRASADPGFHRLVLGPPGSGKTMILVHRAVFLRTRYGLDDSNYRVFLFNNVLKQYVREGFEEVGLPEENVMGIDAWCRQFYRDKIGAAPTTENGRPDFARIRSEVARYLRVKNLQPQYHFVMVDEGQDLSVEVYDILKHIAKHITVFADDQQQIYDDGASIDLIKSNLEISSPTLHLLSAYRCSPKVASLASMFIGDPTSRASFLQRHAQPLRSVEEPLLLVAQSPEDENTHLVDIIRGRVRLNERIAIILPRRNSAYAFHSELERRGLPNELVSTQSRAGETVADFSNRIPKVMNYHNAKGLTFDTVFLPWLRDNAFRHSGDIRSRLLFVAVSRATTWVCLSTVAGNIFAENSLLNQAKQSNCLVERRVGQPGNQLPLV